MFLFAAVSQMDGGLLYRRTILILGMTFGFALLGACTTSEVRYCGEQAGYGDMTCGPAITSRNWRNANR